MLHTKRLTLSEMKAIYDAHMPEAFPPSELRPWKNMEMLESEGHYRAYALYEDDTLIAYAFLSSKDGRYALLDYYAVLSTRRGGGIGSRFFELLREEMHALDGILLEVESVESATTEEERILRERRIAFYLRNGCRLTDVKCLLYGVDFRILELPIQKAAESATAVFTALDSIYHTMFPKALYEKVCFPSIKPITEE